MKRKTLVLVPLLLVLAAACGRAASPAAQPGKQEVQRVVALERDSLAEGAPGAPAAPVAGLPAPSPDEQGGGSLNAFDRMLIRRASLTLGVEDTQATLARIRGIVNGAGGLVSDVSTWSDGENLFANLTVRIPAPVFDQVIEAVKGAAKEVRSESVSGQDVTEEFIDLTARLRNLEATETELLALLTEVRQRTNRAEEVLLIHRELMRIREEIERIQGRRQFLENAVDMATLTIELAPITVAPPKTDRVWQPSVTIRQAAEQLARAFQTLADAAIWLVVYVLPLLALTVGPLAVLVWIGRRVLAGRAAA